MNSALACDCPANARRVDTDGLCFSCGGAHGQPAPVEIVRHRKRGTIYRVISRDVEVQAGSPIVEGDRLVIYIGSMPCKVWARPANEFDDGRFEQVKPGAGTVPAIWADDAGGGP